MASGIASLALIAAIAGPVASAAASDVTVQIPTGGGSAPVLSASVALQRQSSGLISAAAAHAGATAASVSVGGAESSPAVPAGFVGLSIEFDAVAPYADAGSLFAQVLSNLNPGQRPVIRIGGDSTDHAWVPFSGYKNTGLWGYLNPAWIADAKTLATNTDAKLAIGLNLEVNDPKVPVTEERTLEADLGPKIVTAFELGNEPSLYSEFPWYAFNDHPFYTRSKATWTPAAYIKELKATVGSLNGVSLWGPALGANSNWWSSLPQIAAAVPHLTTITDHSYPTSCYVPADSSQAPTAADLLAPQSSTGMAEAAAPIIAYANRTHRGVRIDEINTVTCAGTEGIPSFASTLWATEAGFAMAKAGVSGVNIHTFPKAAYRLFTFTSAGVSVSDQYYGWLLFTRAAPTGSHLLATSTSGNSSVESFAAKAGRSTNVVLINDSSVHSATVTLTVPHSKQATVQPLRGNGLSSVGGVRFDGLTINPSEGALTGEPKVAALGGSGRYSVWLPPASADLLDVTG